MTRGRFKTTKAQRPARGLATNHTRRGRPTTTPEPDMSLVAPAEAPKDLRWNSTDARDEFNRIAPFLLACRRLAAVDRMAIWQYCNQIADLGELFRATQEEGWSPYTDGLTWNDVIHHTIPSLSQTSEVFLASCVKFGLTPATRSIGTHQRAIPDALHQFRGNGNVHTMNLDDIIGQWEPDAIKPYAWMNSAAIATYNDLRTNLEQLRLFTPLDHAPLCVLSGLFELRIRIADDRLALATVHKEEPEEKAHPGFRWAKEFDIILNKYQPHYAMSPTARRKFSPQTKPNVGKKLSLYFGEGA